MTRIEIAKEDRGKSGGLKRAIERSQGIPDIVERLQTILALNPADRPSLYKSMVHESINEILRLRLLIGHISASGTILNQDC